jgi:hypothetical protein
MHYELTDHVWIAIEPMLPDKECGVLLLALTIGRAAAQSAGELWLYTTC